MKHKVCVYVVVGSCVMAVCAMLVFFLKKDTVAQPLVVEQSKLLVPLDYVSTSIDVAPIVLSSDDAMTQESEMEYPSCEHVDYIVNETNVCVASACVEMIGSLSYPTLVAFAHVEGYLGALLSSSRCSDDRIESQWGVDKGIFTAGSRMQLNKIDKAFQSILEGIGYVCQDKIVGGENCLVWKLDTPVPVRRMFEIIPYVEYIQSNDCVQCG